MLKHHFTTLKTYLMPKPLKASFSLAFAFSSASIFGTTAPSSQNIEYDLAVIGGGSAGLATAFEAARHNLKVVVIDYVSESPQKTKWGIGGTCVNVGCIPKKLMHQAARSAEAIVDAHDYGWHLPDNLNERANESKLKAYFNWSSLKSAVQSYIKSINFGYLSSINKDQNLTYINALATFKSANVLLCSKDPKIIKQYIANGELPQAKTQSTPLYSEIKAKYIVIATGTRPSYLPIPGNEHALTSDDIFSKVKPPGKTLVVGGGYVAVEIAGFLRGMGYQVWLMTRGEYLRSFDRDMVNEVMTDLQKRNVKIVPTSLPVNITKKGQDSYEVTIQNQKTGEISKPQDFQTVLFATGRRATTSLLNLSAVSIPVSKDSHKIIRKDVYDPYSTQHPNIFAIGDVVEGLPQLTSTAVKTGQALGKRIAELLFTGHYNPTEKEISLHNYPTTIFTPLQYSCCGFSQQQAIKMFGKDRISVYHLKAIPLEENLLSKYDENGDDYKTKIYAKAIVFNGDKRVLGLHLTAPNSSEIMVGYALAMKLGLTLPALQSAIGIHPTVAEEFTNVKVTKESGQPFSKTSC